MGSEDTRADDGVWQRLQASTSPAGGPVHRHAMPRLRRDADTGELSGRPRHPQGVGWVQLPGEPPTVVPALQSRTWRIAGRSGHRGETCGTEARSRAHVRRRTDRKKSASNRFTCLLQNFLATRKWSDVKPPVAGRDSLQEAGHAGGLFPICDLSVDLAVIYLYPIAESGVFHARSALGCSLICAPAPSARQGWAVNTARRCSFNALTSPIAWST